MELKHYRDIIVTNVGGSESIPVEQMPDIIYVHTTGANLMTNDFSLSYDALPPIGFKWAVLLNPGYNLNGRTLSIFGVSVTTYMQASNTKWVFEFEVQGIPGVGDPVPTLVASLRPFNFDVANILYGKILIDKSITLTKLEDLAAGYFYIGSNTTNRPTPRQISGDASVSDMGVLSIGSKKVTTPKIADKAVQLLQMGDLARGFTYVGDASNRPLPFDLRTALNILCGNAAGTEPVMAPVGGDLEMPSPGVFRIISSVGAFFVAELQMDAAELGTGNSVPMVAVLAQGVGRTIAVIDAFVDFTYNGVPYTTNTILELYCDTATVAQKSLDCLAATTTRIVKMEDVAIAGAADTQLIPNTNLMVRVATGDPGGPGDGTAKIIVLFKILT